MASTDEAAELFPAKDPEHWVVGRDLRQVGVGALQEQPGLPLLTNQRVRFCRKGRRPAGNNATRAVRCAGCRLLGKVQPVLGVPVAGVDGQEALEHPGERLGPALLHVASGGDGLVVVAGSSRVILLGGHIPREPAQQRGGLRLNPPQFLWTSPRRPDTVAMRPGVTVAGDCDGAAVPTPAAAGSRWWSAADGGCTRRSSGRSRPVPLLGCGSGGGRPARP
jgi:hypothetical protein